MSSIYHSGMKNYTGRENIKLLLQYWKKKKKENSVGLELFFLAVKQINYMFCRV